MLGVKPTTALGLTPLNDGAPDGKPAARFRRRIGCGRVAGDVEVEIHADAFEEVVVERDEAHFDRHLQILQAAKLLQQVSDFFVLFLRLVNDQAQVRVERLDGAAVGIHVAPNGRRTDGILNQVDQRIEVGLRTTFVPPGPLDAKGLP